MAEIEKLREEHEAKVEFVIVYIKEAHPDDEWQMDSNRKEAVLYRQPKTFEARVELARAFMNKLNVKTTTLVDDITNKAMACYAAWPERIYVIETDGHIVYKGGMGPFGFKPEELTEFLRSRYGSSS